MTKEEFKLEVFKASLKDLRSWMLANEDLKKEPCLFEGISLPKTAMTEAESITDIFYRG